MARKLALLIAVLYPVAALAGFFTTIRIDNFFIFKEAYQIPWLVFVPGALILLTISLAFMRNAPRRWMRFAIMVWIGLVTWGHHALIAAAAGSV